MRYGDETSSPQKLITICLGKTFHNLWTAGCETNSFTRVLWNNFLVDLMKKYNLTKKYCILDSTIIDELKKYHASIEISITSYDVEITNLHFYNFKKYILFLLKYS